MHCGKFAFVAVIALCGCTSPSTEDPFQTPQDELAFTGGPSRSGANASKLGVKALTQAELMACATTIITINDHKESLSTENRSIKTEETTLTADQKQLEADRAKIDRTSSKQVDAFNKRLLTLQESLRSFNGRVDSYNKAVGEAGQLNNSFNLNCASRPYRVVDLNVLSQVQRQAMESGATPFDLPVYSDEPAPTGNEPSLLIR